MTLDIDPLQSKREELLDLLELCSFPERMQSSFYEGMIEVAETEERLYEISLELKDYVIDTGRMNQTDILRKLKSMGL